jgi:hypothetical protein
MDPLDNINLRIKLLHEYIFALPWSFGGKSKLDKVWAEVVLAGSTMREYKDYQSLKDPEGSRR